MLTAKIQHEGQAIDVPLDQIQLPEGHGLYGPDRAPEGYVSRDFMRSEMETATRGKVKPDELLANDDFFKRAAKVRNIQLGDDLKPVGKLDAEQVRALQQQWTSEHLSPLQEQLQAAQKEADEGRRSNLTNEVYRAAQEAGLKKGRLKTLFEGETPEFIARIVDRAEWDKDRRVYFWRDGAGNPIYADNPTPKNPYGDAGKYLALLKKADKDLDYFEDARQAGSGFEQNGHSGGSKTMRRADFDKMEAQAQIDYVTKGGGKVID